MKGVESISFHCHPLISPLYLSFSLSRLRSLCLAQHSWASAQYFHTFHRNKNDSSIFSVDDDDDGIFFSNIFSDSFSVASSEYILLSYYLVRVVAARVRVAMINRKYRKYTEKKKQNRIEKKKESSNIFVLFWALLVHRGS